MTCDLERLMSSPHTGIPCPDSEGSTYKGCEKQCARIKKKDLFKKYILKIDLQDVTESASLRSSSREFHS